MTRRDAVQALLRSLYDYLPGPKVARFGGLPGPAPSKTAPCKTCGGTGKVGKRGRGCAACSGQGSITVDAYTGEPVGTSSGKVHAAEPRRIEAELRRLEADEAVRRGRTLDEPFAWEAERIRYRRAGSYASLERALDALRVNEPDLYSLVMRCEVYAAVKAGEAAQVEIDRAVDWICRHMPFEVRVPRWVGESPQPQRDWPADRRRSPARQKRNAKIIAMAADGAPQAQIALAVGVSKATVSRVLGSVATAGTAAVG